MNLNKKKFFTFGRKSILFVLFMSFLSADIYNDLAKDPRKFIEALKEKSIEERKTICLKIMNDNEDSDPIAAFQAGNCLLYNGYGELAIPLFTKYIYNGYNQEYFNGRIGYGWMHSADWYGNGSVLSKMTNGQDLYIWVGKKIKAELKRDPVKYGKDPLELEMKESISIYLKKNGFSEEEKKTFLTCKKLKANLNGISCIFVKRKYSNCVKKDTSSSKVFECLEK